ncbi:TRAP transporter small permease [Rhodobacteraceae bacterium CCMM004]|nr:TRAP transporter small permease [Rhodobacteraceae bacterium CCMM004]
MIATTNPATVLRHSLWPALFALCLSYVVWFFPRYIVGLGYGNDNLISSNPAAGAFDWLMLAALAVTLAMGVRTADVTAGEGDLRSRFDRLSLFLGRCTMLLIVALVSVMFYEVVLRYVFERPTLWANEMSLWMAGFIFLLSGLYAMQQRSHIRIFLLYDAMPRWLQRICDVISTSLIVVFAFAMVWGGYTEAAQKLMRWETFGTAFDPPIPATLKPMILLIICIVAVQAVVNLIVDWSRGPEHHGIVDETEVEDMIQTARAQHEQGRHD